MTTTKGTWRNIYNRNTFYVEKTVDLIYSNIKDMDMEWEKS